jgi:heat shock protein HtpX
MKRVLLLIATNVAVMVVLSIVVSVLGLDNWLTANGINYGRCSGSRPSSASAARSFRS